MDKKRDVNEVVVMKFETILEKERDYTSSLK